MPKLDINLPTYESLLTTSEEQRQAMQAERVVKLPVDQISDFEGHPFHVSLDEDMLKLIDSIQENGQMMPVFVRPSKNGEGYEMIAGHRRKFALQQLGLTEIDARVDRVRVIMDHYPERELNDHRRIRAYSELQIQHMAGLVFL